MSCYDRPVMRRLIPFLLLLGVLITVLAPVATAVEEAEDESPAVVSDVEPAVVQDLFIEDEPPTPAWTYRFMIPLLIAISLLAVVGTTVQYFLRVVRSRYQPVE